MALPITREYHVEVGVRGNLYPPDPFIENDRCLRNPRSDGLHRVGVVRGGNNPAVFFVVPAVNYKAAEAWARAECERFGIQVISAKKTRLVPGY